MSCATYDIEDTCREAKLGVEEDAAQSSLVCLRIEVEILGPLIALLFDESNEIVSLQGAR